MKIKELLEGVEVRSKGKYIAKSNFQASTDKSAGPAGVMKDDEIVVTSIDDDVVKFYVVSPEGGKSSSGNLATSLKKFKSKVSEV